MDPPKREGDVSSIIKNLLDAWLVLSVTIRDPQTYYKKSYVHFPPQFFALKALRATKYKALLRRHIQMSISNCAMYSLPMLAPDAYMIHVLSTTFTI